MLIFLGEGVFCWCCFLLFSIFKRIIVIVSYLIVNFFCYVLVVQILEVDVQFHKISPAKKTITHTLD